MSEDLKPSALAGCDVGIGRILITLPLWYAIMFGVLQRIDTPTWLWVAFFVYMPSGILLSVMEEIVKAQVRSGK